MSSDDLWSDTDVEQRELITDPQLVAFVSARLNHADRASLLVVRVSRKCSSVERSGSAMAEGTVMWISSTKHFGFLVLDDGSRDVFVRSLRYQRKTLFVA